MSLRGFVAIGLLVCSVSMVSAAQPERMATDSAEIPLPGPPAALVPADIDSDGDMDVIAVVAYTEWDRVAFDWVEDAALVTDVVPALFNRREIHVFLAEGDGYRAVGEALDISETAYAVDNGPSDQPVLVLTPDGVAVLRVTGASGSETLSLEPLVDDPPVMAGAVVFLPRLSFTEDLTGDGQPDLLLPTAEGLVVHVSRNGHISRDPAFQMEVPGEHFQGVGHKILFYPMPLIDDLNGDAAPDLLFSGDAFRVAFNLGGGRFSEPKTLDLAPALPAPKEDDSDEEAEAESGEAMFSRATLAYLGDLDGDGRPEIVTDAERRLESDAGFRKEIREAKVPRRRFSFHRIDESLTAATEPYAVLDAVGYEFGGGWPDISANAFGDLDGDDRKDLVTITLDFSVLQALKVLTVKRIKIGLDFHVWRQHDDGSFSKVEGLDLSEKLKINLNDLGLKRIAQFAGDFDGDGRVDFVHLGRGKLITIHLGQPGARYPVEPDLAIELSDELEALELVRVLDIDGDGHADLVVTRPGKIDEEGETAPVVLEVHRTRVAGVGEEGR